MEGYLHNFKEIEKGRGPSPLNPMECDFSRFGVQDIQECPFEDRNGVAIMFTMPGRVSDDHPFLTLFAAILLPLVSPPLHGGWDTVLSAEKYPVFT
jgi:hypothetical protein